MVAGMELVERWQNAKRFSPQRTVNPVNLNMTVNNTRILDFDDQGDFFLRSANGGPQLGTIYFNEAAAILSEVENLHVHNHGDIKLDVNFQQLYGLGLRNMNFIQPNAQPGTRTLPTYPCHYCGIVLPVDLIEIDHVMPKNAGANGEMAAIMKVLRTIDGRLAVGQSQGRKAAAYAQGNIAFLPPKAVPNGGGVGGNYAAGWNSNLPNPANQAKLDRYTPTQMGDTMLALGFLWFGTGVTGFQHHCMNNLLNLVPACRKCNGSKTNIAFAKR